MVKKASAAPAPAPAPADAEDDKRRRLRSLAFSNGLLQQADPPAPRTPLAPSDAVARLQGRDIVRRGGQRKSRFLFSFPGLLAPAASAGRVGELADLGTKNPLLYLESPQGMMKLFGTHVYPKNKYLTLQMTRSAKGVVCEDVFESLIVFSEAWWVGTKQENPQELKLEFPKEFQNDGAAADCDFRGGAGAAIDEATAGKAAKEVAEPRTPKFESDGDASNNSDQKDGNATQTTSGTPSVRQSARNVGKALKKYTDLSSGGDSSNSDNEVEVPEDLDEKEIESPAVKDERQSEDIKPADLQQGPSLARRSLLFRLLCLACLKRRKRKRDLQEVLKDPLQQKVLLLRSSEQVQWRNSQQGSRKLVELEENKHKRLRKMKSKTSQVPHRMTLWMMTVTRTGRSDALVCASHIHTHEFNNWQRMQNG